MAKVPSYWTVLTMLEWATEYFEDQNVRSPRMSIEWLLADVLQIKRLDLYLKYDRPLAADELEKLRPLVKRRAAHEPLQYITGETDFLNVRIRVRKGVLIPRSETEQLTEIILSEHPADTDLRMVDLGTGSGCIPIAIKKARPGWKVTATDISETALKIAASNAELNETDISFKKDDLKHSTLEDEFDLIVSNPPYIRDSEKDSLDREVIDFEPAEALFCNSTREIFSGIERFLSEHLTKDGNAYLEISEFQANETMAVFDDRIWKSRLIQDYDKKDRFLHIRRA